MDMQYGLWHRQLGAIQMFQRFHCPFSQLLLSMQTAVKPWKDIYMYRGDTAFCSEECCYQQILMDDEMPLTTDFDG